MDKTEFIKLPTFEEREKFDLDTLLDEEKEKSKAPAAAKEPQAPSKSEQDLLDELGI